MFVPLKDLKVLDMTVEEAFKMIATLGLVQKEDGSPAPAGRRP
jgi:uncharacterized membrane protein